MEKGLSSNEQSWLIAATVVSAIAIISSYLLMCPMPIVLAFGFDAFTFANMECEV